MRNQIFERIVFVNATGNQTIISDTSIDNRWEMIGRQGFTAPEVEVITETYANGVTKTLQRILKPRTVSIKMLAFGTTPERMDAEFEEMIATLMDISNGVEGKLYITRTDGSVVYLNCLYSGGANVEENYRKFRQFTLEFYASDPYFYRDIEDALIEIPPSARLTLRNSLMLGQGHVMGENSGYGQGIVINNSQEIMQPILRIYSLKGSVIITNETNGDVVEFDNIVVGKGKTLVVDTRDAYKNIYIEEKNGDVTPAGQYLNWSNIGFEFRIMPGTNSIKFATEELSASLGMLLKLSERYLSA